VGPAGKSCKGQFTHGHTLQKPLKPPRTNPLKALLDKIEVGRSIYPRAIGGLLVLNQSTLDGYSRLRRKTGLNGSWQLARANIVWFDLVAFGANHQPQFVEVKIEAAVHSSNLESDQV
jgi:hypothetical protein